MTKETIEFYKSTSEFTYLGKYKEEAIDLWENKCERSLKKLCLHLMNVTVHRVIVQMALKGASIKEYGNFDYIDYTNPMSEDDIFLTSSAMFCEIFRRDEKGFYVGRPAEKRLNLTCRYISVLTSAILKANGIPCRCRAGWARYLRKNKCLDHWVNEYWDEDEKRWIMFDMDDLYDSEYMKFKFYEDNKISTEYLDFGPNQFYTAADAWLNYRKDKNFIHNFQYGSSKSLAKEVLKYLFLDFMAIMNFEVNYKFIPMAFDKKIENLTKDELKEIDYLATLMLDIDKNFNKIKELYDNTPKYRMLNSPLVDKDDFTSLIDKKGYKI